MCILLVDLKAEVGIVIFNRDNTAEWQVTHKQHRIVNKLHNWIPEVREIPKIYLWLIRVHIHGTGFTLVWPHR